MEAADLRLCVAVNELGSLRGAADRLQTSASSVTKRLAALESGLGVKLFLRSTRRVSPTPAGEAFCAQAAQLVAQFDALSHDMRERQVSPSGHVRLVSSFGFGRRWVGPALASFAQRHPQLTVQLVLREHLPDLGAEGFDAAVWLWRPQSSREGELSAKLLAPNRRVLVAAPSYLQTRPPLLALADLRHHACLTVHEHHLAADHWVLSDVEGVQPTQRVRINGQLSTNSGELAMDWCLGGHGLLLRSLWDASDAIADGRLTHVLPGWAMLDANVQWLTPFQIKPPKRVALLARHLSDAFLKSPWNTQN